MAKPKRTFSADVGQQSTGTAGPDQMEYDLDNLFAMLDPNDLLRDNSPGGINTENMRASAVTDAILGNRTVDQAIVDVESNTGTLTQLLSWIVKHIKAVKGNVTNWYDAAATSLSALWDKFNATTGHKHTGTANDAPQIGASGIAEGAVIDSKIGNRTVDQTTVPASDTGTLTTLLSGIVNRLKAITGKLDWKNDPTMTLEAVASYVSAGDPYISYLVVTADTIAANQTGFVSSGEERAYLNLTINGAYRVDGGLFCNDLIIGVNGRVVVGPNGEVTAGTFV